MARIAFFVLPNIGCFNASLKLALDLKYRGHEVWYIGLADSEDYIRSNGFDFLPTFQGYFPRGYYAQHLRDEALPLGLEFLRMLKRRLFYFSNLFRDLIDGKDEELLGVLKDLKPDLVVFASGDPYIEYPALIAHSLNIKGIYFYDVLWTCRGSGLPPIESDLIPNNSIGSKIRVYLSWKKKAVDEWIYFFGFKKFAKKLASKYGYCLDGHDSTYKRQTILRLPELLSFPSVFDFPGTGIPGRYYIGASVCLERYELPFSWQRFDANRPVAYCALGTVLWFDKTRYREFFETVIGASAIRPDWQWVLSTGGIITERDLSPLPSNVMVVDHAPQLKLLQRTTIMITHGGASSIKESIYFGVPMIVFPLGADQPGNAARVVYHGLGVQSDLRKINVRDLQKLIETVDRSTYIRSQIQIMQRKFREVEEEKLGVKYVDMILEE